MSANHDRLSSLNEALQILVVALLLFLAVLTIDILLAPKIPWGAQTAIYWMVLYCSWLIGVPICIYMSGKWPPRNVSKLLALSLIFWSIEDSLYYYILGYSTFSPFPENPGMYPLMIYWWPAWFMVLSRFFAGLIIFVYVGINPDWGEEPVRLSLGREQVRWILKVAVFVSAGVVIAWSSYSYYTAGGFGGRIVYRTDPSYGREPWPESVYRGILVRRELELTRYNIQARYVLVRPGNLSELILAKPYWMLGSDSPSVLDSYLDKQVEILGKLVERQDRYELFAARIREATGKE